MTWKSRFRLFFGTIMVVALVAALTVALSHRKGEVEASSAAVDARTYPVGTDYPGAVLEQFVEAGDSVTAGDPVATIQSNDLVRDLNDDIVVATSDVFQINPDNTLTVKSAVSGVVLSVDVRQGAYAPAGGSVATVASLDSLFVNAEFVLDPADFARIEQGAAVRVTLPNGGDLEGTVGQVEPTTVAGEAITVVEVIIDDERFTNQDEFIRPGTPVTAVMELRNDDVLANFTTGVRSLIADVRAALAL
jgi:multidrug resistance efflux pump